MTTIKTNRGISLLSVLLLGFIAILVLSHFHISIQSEVESPESQENFNYVGNASASVWVKYLKAPAVYLWRDVWVNIFWRTFISNMERLRDGEPSDLDKAAENLRLSQ